MLDSEPASSPSHPSLHLIIDHQNPILVQQLPQPLEIFWRRNNVSALSLNGFDEERRNILRRQILVYDLLLYEVDTVHVAFWVSHLERASVAVREGNVSVTWNHRKEVSALHRLARGKTQRSKCPSVERACEAEETVFSRMPLCKLHRGLNSLGPAITEKHFLLEVPWSYLDKFLRQLNNFFIIEVGP